ncbi:BRCT domain-containing protein, partial [Enterobacter hormaechei]
IILEGDAVLERVLTMQLTETARSLDIDGLREGTAEKIVKNGGYETFNDMFSAIAQWPRKWWLDLIGENGGKIYDDFHSKMSSVPLSVWLGSMPHFGRGVGRRKMKALCEGLDIKTLDDFNAITEEQIVSVDKFSYKTAAKVLAGMAEHAELFNKIQSIIGFKQQVTSGDRFTGEKIVITGFRDAALEKLIEAEGGEVQSSVSSKTTMVIAASTSGSSGKLKKVHDLNNSGKANIKLIDLATFRKQYLEQPASTGLEF